MWVGSALTGVINCTRLNADGAGMYLMMMKDGYSLLDEICPSQVLVNLQLSDAVKSYNQKCASVAINSVSCCKSSYFQVANFWL